MLLEEKTKKMSGRGRNQYSGRGRGHRGGRGGFQRRNNDNRQIEMKFLPYGASGSSRSTLATFAQVKEALILKIEKGYERGKDIAESIQQMNYIDMKKFLSIKDKSTETDFKLKKQQNESFQMIFKEEIKIYSERKTMLEKNKSSSAALIKSNYC